MPKYEPHETRTIRLEDKPRYPYGVICAIQTGSRPDNFLELEAALGRSVSSDAAFASFAWDSFNFLRLNYPAQIIRQLPYDSETGRLELTLPEVFL